jgi:biotin carboxylase
MSDLQACSQTVLCIASFFKGNEFLRECKRRGWGVVLLTRAKLCGEDWARESIDELVALPGDGDTQGYLDAATHVARFTKVARVVALEEYDIVTAARLREELCLPGLGATAARRFRDKLAMRVKARDEGIREPEFVHLLNPREIAEFLRRVEPPWMLKPRVGASAMGMRKLREPEEVWRALAELDARANPRARAHEHLLESYVRGEVFHVDSLVADGRVLFASAARYGTPPFDVAHAGGVSTSHTIRRNSRDHKRLLALNKRLLAEFGFERGTTHAEFIKGERDDEFYFLEVAARVGGAHTAEMVEAASGINLWREWARVETATTENPYQLPPVHEDYAGIAVSLAREERPDTSAFDDPEISFRVNKPWHVGLVVRSPDERRVASLLDSYARRFAAEFTAFAPAEETAGKHL